MYLGVICLGAAVDSTDACLLGVELELPDCCETEPVDVAAGAPLPGMGLVTTLMVGRLGEEPRAAPSDIGSKLSRVRSGVSKRLPDMDNRASSLTDDLLETFRCLYFKNKTVHKFFGCPLKDQVHINGISTNLLVL